MNVSISNEFEAVTTPQAHEPLPGLTAVASADSPRAFALSGGDRSEVLTFLSARPLHNVALASLVLDNGLESVLNRGRFYACRGQHGALEGVALVGHTVLFDARTDDAVRALALAARGRERKHLLMGEAEPVERFWHFYAGDAGLPPRFKRRVHMLERSGLFDDGEAVKGLRPATLSDLSFVMSIQAEMVAEESGTNPLESDRLGFHVRCARRVERGRVWVCVVEGRPVFKADVIAETREAAYLEGVYVSPELRGRGFGSRCLVQTCRAIHRAGTKAVCLFADERNERARRFYERAGFSHASQYLILYF